MRYILKDPKSHHLLLCLPAFLTSRTEKVFFFLFFHLPFPGSCWFIRLPFFFFFMFSQALKYSPGFLLGSCLPSFYLWGQNPTTGCCVVSSGSICLMASLSHLTPHDLPLSWALFTGLEALLCRHLGLCIWLLLGCSCVWSCHTHVTFLVTWIPHWLQTSPSWAPPRDSWLRCFFSPS